jgi:hypothetical protein
MSIDSKESQVDITAPELVDITINEDGKVVWINVDGVCRFRAQRIKNLAIYDGRKDSEENNDE